MRQYYMRKILFSLIALSLVLGACGKKEEDPAETGVLPIDEDELIDNDKIALTINDEEILGNVYNLMYVQTKIQLYNFGQDIKDTDLVKEMSINTLVEQELLKQAANDEGIEVTEEEVESKYEELMADNGDNVNEFLEEYNLNADAFKNQISFSLYLNEYMETFLQVEVSEDEVKEFYEKLKEENENTSEFEEIKAQIKERIVTQKQQEKVKEILDELKEKSTIETHI